MDIELDCQGIDYGMADPQIKLQASAVPYRRSQANIELCLITTRRTGRWVFPKGNAQCANSLTHTALQEADEEAGLVGEIDNEALGTYSQRKDGRLTRVTAFLMQVEHSRESWKEDEQRQRCWVSAAEAEQMLDRPELRELLRSALTRIHTGGGGQSALQSHIA